MAEGDKKLETGEFVVPEANLGEMTEQADLRESLDKFHAHRTAEQGAATLERSEVQTQPSVTAQPELKTSPEAEKRAPDVFDKVMSGANPQIIADEIARGKTEPGDILESLLDEMGK